MNVQDSSMRAYAKKFNIAKRAILFMTLFMILSYSPSAEAHATLLEVEPAENVVAEEAPSELMLRFNEPIEHELALITVYDSDAKTVFTGNPDGNTDKSPKLTFSLPELDDGTYTVKWDIVSVDGHPVGGSYAFSVGESTKGGIKQVDESSGPEGALTLVRIIPEGLLLLGAGLIWFGWLAEKRQFPSLDKLWKKGRHIGSTLIVLGTIAELVTYCLSLPPGIIQVILNGRWELLQQFPFILMLFAQMLFLILLFIPGMVRGWYLTLWLIVAVTPAFGGHVWSMEHPFIALVPRVIHQMAIAFWLGALCYVILLLIWQRKQETSVSWKAFRPFFVNRMIAASGLVVATGVIMVYLQTGIIAVFTDWKMWSAIVIAKVLLTALMGSFALFQTLKWKKNKTFTTRRLVRTEWLIGLVVIVLGVWISQISYPISVKTYDETLTADHINAEVSIDQLQMGNQAMSAGIAQLDGEQPKKVQVKVSMPQHDMGSDDLTAEKDDDGNYTVELPFSMSGTWHLEITATYPDSEKVEWDDEIFIAGDGD